MIVCINLNIVEYKFFTVFFTAFSAFSINLNIVEYKLSLYLTTGSK